MTKYKLDKFFYLLLMQAFMLASINMPVFAGETINAAEIAADFDIENADNQEVSIDSRSQFLDSEDNYKKTIDPNRPELVIKNPFEVLKAKKSAKKNTVSNEGPQEDSGIKIYCTEMEYLEDTGELEAVGNVKIESANGVNATADKAVYNKGNNTIKLTGNVVLNRDNSTVNGDYMFIDLNEENALMDEPVTKLGTITVNAKEGFAYSDHIENINGNVELNRMVETEISSNGFTRYGRAINDKRLVDFELKKERSKPYTFKTKEIVIRPERDHDSMILKDVDIYYNRRKILNVPSIEFFSDKQLTYSEVNFPLEFGSIKGLGMYLGLGYTFKLPESYTFRLTPMVSYSTDEDDEWGIGAIAQLKSKRLNLEAGWASNTNNLIVDGEFKITDKLRLDVGRHAYKNEWFNGGNRAGYLAEISFDDRYIVKDLGNAVFRHRITAGYVADYKRKHQEDNMKDGYRYRYMAELSKSLKKFGSREQDMFLDFGVFAQTMATVYSETGDTFGMARIGPRIISRLKNWNSIIAYTVGGVHGQTPYRFDEYRYGRQSVMFDESLILNRFISVGYRGTLTPLKDNRKKDVLTENRLYAVVGPEDIKIAFSYDTIRQNMHFDFLFLLGSDNLDLQYEKMSILDPNKLGKTQRPASDKDLYKVKIPEDL
ncbi:MAG: LPS export ABC transporter periplasmic protein LptC [Candidatus Gastranaerophilales bacterium]|nr:LPS export ABC transporter periplasmic protein LptC [Candidatus Gastranaerophilales bacterium]